MIAEQFYVLFHNEYGGTPADLGYAVGQTEDGTFTATKGNTSIALPEHNGRLVGWVVNGVDQGAHQLRPRDQAAADKRHAALTTAG